MSFFKNAAVRNKAMMIATAFLAVLTIVQCSVKPANAGPFQELTSEQLFQYIWQDFGFKIFQEPDPAIGRRLICFYKDSNPKDGYCPVTNAESEKLMEFYKDKVPSADKQPDDSI